MEPQVGKMWTIFFTRLACSDICLDKAADDYRNSLSLATFVDLVLANYVGKLGNEREGPLLEVRIDNYADSIKWNSGNHF